MTAPSPFDPKTLVGLGEQDALTLIRLAGLTPRLTRRDGVALIGTQDYRLDRVNLSVAGGTVEKATLG